MDPIDSVPGRAAHRLYCHFVWPTLGRIPLVSSDAAAVLERHIITLCRRLDVEPVCVRAFADRLHMLLRLKPGHAPGTLVKRLKGGSEAALQAAGHTVRWGRGYAVASVSGGEVRAVMRRIHRLADGPLGRGPSPSRRTRPRSPVRAPRRTDRWGAPGVVDALRPER